MKKSRRTQSRTLVLGSIATGLALGFVGIADGHARAQVTDIGESAAVYWDIDVGEESHRRVLQERYLEDYIRRTRVEREQVPEVSAPPKPQESEVDPVACAYNRALIEELRPRVLGAIPGSKLQLEGTRQNIDRLFSEVIRYCPEPEEQDRAEPSVEVLPIRVRDSKCGRYGHFTRRGVLCRANQLQNQPYLGGQMRLQRLWELEQ